MDGCSGQALPLYFSPPSLSLPLPVVRIRGMPFKKYIYSSVCVPYRGANSYWSEETDVNTKLNIFLLFQGGRRTGGNERGSTHRQEWGVRARCWADQAGAGNCVKESCAKVNVSLTECGMSSGMENARGKTNRKKNRVEK